MKTEKTGIQGELPRIGSVNREMQLGDILYIHHEDQELEAWWEVKNSGPHLGDNFYCAVIKQNKNPSESNNYAWHTRNGLRKPHEVLITPEEYPELFL